MKNRLPVIFSFFILYCCSNAFGQNNVIKQKPCSNEFIMGQADSIKKEFTKMGFVVLKEASVSMESEYEMQVIVPLNESNLYHFVFIGDITSKLYEVRMYDWNERQVVYKKNQWGDVDGNIINYDYIPRFSEYHMIKPVQVNKKKKLLCGYVLLLKKVK